MTGFRAWRRPIQQTGMLRSGAEEGGGVRGVGWQRWPPVWPLAALPAGKVNAQIYEPEITQSHPINPCGGGVGVGRAGLGHHAQNINSSAVTSPGRDSCLKRLQKDLGLRKEGQPAR